MASSPATQAGSTAKQFLLDLEEPAEIREGRLLDDL